MIHSTLIWGLFMNYKYLFIFLILLVLSSGTVNAHEDNSGDFISIEQDNNLVASNKSIDDAGKICENSNISNEDELKIENNLFDFSSDGEYSVNASNRSSIEGYNYLKSDSILINYNSYPGDDPVYIRYNAFISAENIIIYCKNGTPFTATLHDGSGNPIANKTLSFEINGMCSNRTTDENGSASIAIDLNEGWYVVNVTFSPGGFFPDISNIYGIVVLPTIEASNLIKRYNDNTPYYAVFLDGQGNPLADGTNVTFNINGVSYIRQINGNEGQAALNINLNVGRYIITVTNPITNETRSDDIWISSLIINNVDMVKYFKNATQFVVTIIGMAENAAGAGVNVTFNINGVFYTRQTNSSGQVKLNINLQPGKYTITTIYDGFNESNTIKVLPILSAEDLFVKQGRLNHFKVLLYDGQGNPYANQEVRFNINGVFYTKTTDSYGYAVLNIASKAAVGTYIVTSSFNGAIISNNITILKSALVKMVQTPYFF